jgi:hypothetical protein
MVVSGVVGGGAVTGVCGTIVNTGPMSTAQLAINHWSTAAADSSEE